jgi:hypothetical protein
LYHELSENENCFVNSIRLYHELSENENCFVNSTRLYHELSENENCSINPFPAYDIALTKGGTVKYFRGSPTSVNGSMYELCEGLLPDTSLESVEEINKEYRSIL